MVHRFSGVQNQSLYFRTVSEVPGGTLSPGGAASVLGCTRQYINELMRTDKLEAWVFYGPEGRSHYVCVSARDIRDYAEKHGKKVDEALYFVK